MRRVGVVSMHAVAGQGPGGPGSTSSIVSGPIAAGDPSKVVMADGELVSIPAYVNYYAGPVRSLTPDGTIYFSTDASGNQVGTPTEGMVFQRREVVVGNARRLPDAFLERGFSLKPSPTRMSYQDFFQNDKVMNEHYAECEALLKQVLGAGTVLPFDYIVRSEAAKARGVQVQGGQGVQGPASGAHADYTVNGAPRRLEQLAGAARSNDLRSRSLSEEELGRAKAGRWCIVNVWRSIRDEPAEHTPLALLDCTTVSEEDFVCLEQRYVDRTGENYLPHHSEKHRWYYFPRVTRGEALLIKAWDSSTGPVSARCSVHGAIKDPSSPPGAPDRESIEVRCLVIF